MALLGTLLRKGIKIREILSQEYASPFDLQKIELKTLLLTATSTDFGRYYQFPEILEVFKSNYRHHFYNIFKNLIPVSDYNSMYSRWWYRNLKGDHHVCWPGKVNYFALSSGTSEAGSKYIPVTKEMSKAIRKTSMLQILTLSKYKLPDNMFETGILMLGGSTHLNYNGRYFSGDLSGITASQLPFWFQHFYKPGRKIAKTRNWEEKLKEITARASSWDIGVIVGVPAWIQILLERIISHYHIRNIHEIWPNLSIYVHGGVSFEPYKKGFEKLLGKPIYYIETYLASEGFVAFQAEPHRNSMRMVLNNGTFYEFIPFNEKNFDFRGELRENHESLMIDQISENVEYALVMSTCAGAWRYLIGDVIKFVSKKESEIIITGRTMHYLSLCGEHLSIDNMNKAISVVSEELNLNVREFTVAGIPHDNLFAHHWYIGTDDQVDSEELKQHIDNVLMQINDDYKVERSAALKEIFLDVIPTRYFYQWMKLQGKEGGQNKFPRVIKSLQLLDWRSFLDKVSRQTINLEVH